MRLAWLLFAAALGGLWVWPVSDALAAVAGLAILVLLPLLGYREGTWRALRWALVVPAAAVVADGLVFTPLTLQPDTDAALFTYAAVLYLPVWLLLVAGGVVARWLQRRRRRPPRSA